LTPLGTSLDNKILQPLVLGPARANSLRKPVLVIAVSDGGYLFSSFSRLQTDSSLLAGEPAGEARDHFVNVIRNAKNVLQQTRYGPDTLSVELAQVGNDRKAKEYMDALDSDPHVGGLIDVTGTYEFEQEQMQRITGASSLFFSFPPSFPLFALWTSTDPFPHSVRQEFNFPRTTT
jgi:hypothetical protein